MAESSAARPDSKRRVRMGWLERQVRGSLSRIEGRDGLRVVNERVLEDYVAGTLLGEVSKGFGDVVLRAQAIATRTRALHARAHPRSPNDAAPCHQRMRTEPLSSLTARVAGTSVLAASGSVLGASQ